MLLPDALGRKTRQARPRASGYNFNPSHPEGTFFGVWQSNRLFGENYDTAASDIGLRAQTATVAKGVPAIDPMTEALLLQQ
jgi:hypothetical protein